MKRVDAFSATLPVLIVVTFVFATNLFFDGQTLTGEQEARHALGSYHASFSRLSTALPPGSPVMAKVKSDLDRADADADVALLAPDFPLFDLANDGLYYREMDWTPNRFGGVLRVKEGRFPDKPREVAVIAGQYSNEVEVGGRLSVLGDADALAVVGIIDDTLVRRQGILAAPGTWQSLRPPDDATLSRLSASPAFYFADGDYDDDVAIAVRSLAARAEEHLEGADEREVLDAAYRALVTRENAQKRAQAPWTSRSPLSFWAPSGPSLKSSVGLLS